MNRTMDTAEKVGKRMKRKRTKSESTAVAAATDEMQPAPANEEQSGEGHDADLDFFARVQSLRPEDWQQNGFKIYIYRTWPVIDRRDQEHFILKAAEQIDEDWLLRFCGSGKYNVRLNDRQGHTIAQKTISLHNVDFPPKVSPDEVIASDPRNQRYFEVWVPKSNRDAPKAGADCSTRASHGNGGEVTDAAVKLAIEQSRGRDELARELASRATAPSVDPLGTLDKAAEVIRKLQPNGGSLDLTAVLRDELADVRKQMAEERTERRRLEQELFQAKTATPEVPDPIDTFSKLLENFKRLRQVMPEEQTPPIGADEGGWLAFLSGPSGSALINQAITPLASAAAQFFLSRINGSVAAQTPNAVVQAPGAIPSETDEQRILRIAQTITPPMVSQYFDRQESGDLFAEHVFNLWSEDYLFLRRFGAEGILKFIRERNPKLWAYLANREQQFTLFIEEFCAWNPDEEESTEKPHMQTDDGFEEKSDADAPRHS